MSHKTLINGANYEVTGGKGIIDNTNYDITSGKTLIDGSGYDIPFVKGIPVSELVVGDSIYMQEYGNRVEFVLINKGLPSASTLYDASCDGLWVLRKDILKSTTITNTSTYISDYATSNIPSELDSYVAGAFDDGTKDLIKQVKIPYAAYNKNSSTGSVFSGESGLSCRAFLLCYDEVVGAHYNQGYCPSLGGWTEYYIFDKDGDNSEFLAARAKRVKYFDGSAAVWHTRSPSYDYNPKGIYAVLADGNVTYQFLNSGQTTIHLCPAMILDFSATVDENNKLITQ